MPQVVAVAVAAFQAAATVATTVGAAMGLSGIAATVAGAASIISSTTQMWSAVSSAIGSKPKVNAPSTQLQTKVGAVTARAIVMGRAPVAGTLLTPTPLQSGRGNALATNVYTLSHAGPSGVVESVIWGDDTVTFDAQGQAIGKYANNMWLFQKNGSWSQTSITFTGTPGIGADTPTAWDSTKRAQGCLVVALVVRYAASVLANNMQTPLFVVDANAVALTDPRTGSAATTQAQRRNPAVWAYSWRLGWFQNSRRVMGLGQPAAELHAAGYAYAANVADANGWTISGEASTADDRYAVEMAILQACASVPVERNGLQSVVTSATRSSVGTITSNDLRADPKWRYNTQQSSRPTAIQTRFRSETNRWQMVEGAEVTDASWLTQDAGREKRVPIEYAYAGGGSAHVGHLAALDASNAREPLVFTLQCKQQARYAGFVGDAVTVSLPEIGLSSTKMVVVSRIVNPDGTVDYELLVETDAKYAFAAGKTSAAPSFTLQPGFDIFSVPQPDLADWASVAAQITSGATSLPIVRVTGSAANYNFASGVVFKLRLNSIGSPWLVSEDAPPAATQHEFRGLTNNTGYIVGVAYRGVTGVEGAVRELTAVTTGTLVAGEAGAGVGGAPILNSLVPVFNNSVVDDGFNFLTNTSIWNFYGITATRSKVTSSGGLVQLYMDVTGTPANNSPIGAAQAPAACVPIAPGQRVEVSAHVGGLGLASIDTYVFWYDANGSLLSTTLAGRRIPVGSAVGGFNLTNYVRIGDFATAPANAQYAGFACYGYTDGTTANPSVRMTMPLISPVGASQTVLSPYSKGQDAAPGATVGATVGSDFRFPDGSIAPIGRVDNIYNAIGSNCNADTDFLRLTDTEIWTLVNAGTTSHSRQVGANDFSQYLAQISGTPAASQLFGRYGSGKNRLGVSAGERVQASALVGGFGLDGAWIQIFWWNAAGSIFQSNGKYVTSLPTGALNPSNYKFDGVVADVPSGAVAASFNVYGNTAGSVLNPYLYTAQEMLCKVQAGQAALVPFNQGFRGQPGADVTSGNTAGGFIGQGTEATVNRYRQSSAPSSPINGDIWEDTSTTPPLIKKRIAGAWVTQAEEGADVTANATPILEGPSSVSFDVDSAGALSPGSQVPLTLQFIRKRGATDVSTTTTWSVPSTSNCTLGTITNGGVNVTAVAAGNSAFTVRSVRDGVTIDHLVTVQKNTIAAGVISATRKQVTSNSGTPNNGNWTDVASMVISATPTGNLFFNSSFATIVAGTGTCSHEARLTVDGVQVGAIQAAQATVTGGVPEAVDFEQTFAQVIPVTAGSRTIAFQLRRTTGAGQITTSAITFDVAAFPG